MAGHTGPSVWPPAVFQLARPMEEAVLQFAININFLEPCGSSLYGYSWKAWLHQIFIEREFKILERSEISFLLLSCPHSSFSTICLSVCASLSSLYPFFRPSVRLAARPHACPPAHPSVRPSACSPVRMSVRPSVRSSVRPSVRPSFRSFIRSPVRPCANPSVHPPARPSVHWQEIKLAPVGRQGTRVRVELLQVVRHTRRCFHNF